MGHFKDFLPTEEENYVAKTLGYDSNLWAQKRVSGGYKKLKRDNFKDGPTTSGNKVINDP